jgi:hypothetical protein
MVTSLSPTVPNILFGNVGGSTDCVSITLPGYSVGMIYAIRTAGVDPASGRRIFLDGNGKKVLYEQVPVFGKNQWEYEDGSKAPAIATATDAVVYRNTTPTVYGGFNNTFNYKRLSLNVLFTYQFGGYMYYGTQGTLMDARFSNNSTMIMNRWRKPGDITDVPRMDAGRTADFDAASDRWLIDGSYLNIRSVTLSYNLPKTVSQKLYLENAQVYLSGENLMMFSRRSGMGVQQGFSGVTSNVYSTAKSLVLGISFSL